MSSSYLETTKDFYKTAAISPMEGLCCTTTPIWRFPELEIPSQMLEMNYGCGTTVHPRDLVNSPKVLYVGIGGGLEIFQFSYFCRKPSGVIGVDPVPEMLEACQTNLSLAEPSNPWFQRSFIELRQGDALSLPIADESVDVAAQNCLFNIFRQKELKLALEEMYRVLRPNGRLVLSDPVCETQIPETLRSDEGLRALCLSGAIPLREYLELITETGFGTVEVRARRPYRVLDPTHYPVDELIFIESVEVCAIKDPVPPDGPCIFTGRTAIYYGTNEVFDDGHGHSLMRNQPLSICDKTAGALESLGRQDIYITPSTFFYDGGGCC
ncbi:MAG: arsenosugar biosynthesis arsenite methyltransferase ArsM [Acidobacteriota bacterium]|nr:MAG: arsenosugar biosynthesis arsenite methyltransferase ArsM [Acidobacteriota bacterium]